MTVIADDKRGCMTSPGSWAVRHRACSDATTEVLLEMRLLRSRSASPARDSRLNLTSATRASVSSAGSIPAFLDAGLALLSDVDRDASCGGEACETWSRVAGQPPDRAAQIRRIRTRSGRRDAGRGQRSRPKSSKRILGTLGFAAHAGGSRIGDDAVVGSSCPAGGPTSTVAARPGRGDRAHLWPRSRSASVALPRADGVARPTATPANRSDRAPAAPCCCGARGLNEAVTWSFPSRARSQRVRARNAWTGSGRAGRAVDCWRTRSAS